MKTVAIIGGGFCGARCAKILDKALPKDWKILLFDRKDYFEYTPSIHRGISDPGYAKKIRVTYRSFLKRTKIITDTVLNAGPQSIQTGNERYSYDFLVLAMGASTPVPKKALGIKTFDDVLEIRKSIENGGTVAIIGGGFTGTELAGEIVTKTKKPVIIIEKASRLLPRQPEKASKKALEFLRRRNARVEFNADVISISDGMINTTKGPIEASTVIWCTGIRPNTDNIDFPKDDRGFIITEPSLNVKGFANVFAGGDITNTPEEKSAQNAENHGLLIAKNICNIAKVRLPENYEPGDRLMVISLGEKYSILTKGSNVVTGFIPSKIKRAIEMKVMSRYRSPFPWKKQ